ncbi:hypothetical protein JOD20_004937 [Herpetosiphon giganteus]|nr:hypothetical protein [Herpetosiphon giganteus]
MVMVRTFRSRATSYHSQQMPYRTLVKSHRSAHVRLVAGLLPALCTPFRQHDISRNRAYAHNPCRIHELTAPANRRAPRFPRATSPGMLFLICPRQLTLCHAPGKRAIITKCSRHPWSVIRWWPLRGSHWVGIQNQTAELARMRLSKRNDCSWGKEGRPSPQGFPSFPQTPIQPILPLLLSLSHDQGNCRARQAN